MSSSEGRMSLRERIAEQCYWDYMGQDSKWHPLSLVNASEDMQQEMLNRADRILAEVAKEVKGMPLAENPYPFTVRWNDPRYMDRVSHECFKDGIEAERANVVTELRKEQK